MRNKQEQWAVLKRLLSYLKPYRSPHLFSTRFSPYDDCYQERNSPSGFRTLSTSIYIISTSLLLQFC